MHLIYGEKKSIFSFFYFFDKSPIKWSIFVSIRNKNNKEQQTTSNRQPELLTGPFYSFFLAVYRKQNPVHILMKTKGNRNKLSMRSSKKWYKTIQLIFQSVFFYFFLFFFFFFTIHGENNNVFLQQINFSWSRLSVLWYDSLVELYTAHC